MHNHRHFAEGVCVVYKVLVVDDSVFFQNRLKEIIDSHPELSVVGIATNGNEAIAKAQELKPDVISMDYEMPYLDGVSAVRAIMAKRQVPIVMFSSMTYEGARITLDALAAGAVDFIPKNLAEVCNDSGQVQKKLHETLLYFARKFRQSGGIASPVIKASAPARTVEAHPEKRAPKTEEKLRGRVKLVVIGTSTGGPVALTEVLQALPADMSVPVVVIQHMPENFTKVLAERLHRQCAIAVVEAADGDAVQPGKVLVAPGGRQLMFDRRGCVRVMDGDERVKFRPCVDLSFASAANVYGAGVLAVVLTGMGSDGCEGARILKQGGAHVWGQDERSCTVYGMPRAVAKAGLVDDVLPLNQIGPRLVWTFSA